MKNNRIFISLTMSAIVLVLVSLVLIGCTIEQKISKLKVYSVLAEQHEHDINGVTLGFNIIANYDKAPYSTNNIDNVYIEASNNFREELTLKNDITTVSTENYKNKSYYIYYYKFKTRKGVTPGYYTDAKLTFVLKNNDRITFKVGEFSIRSFAHDLYSMEGDLFRYMSNEHIPNPELPLTYRINIIKYTYEYTTKPFIVKSINYKHGQSIDPKDYKLQSVGNQNTLEIRIPHRDLVLDGLNLEIVGIIDGKEITQVIPANVGYLTIAEFLTSAGELCSEPISKNY